MKNYTKGEILSKSVIQLSHEMRVYNQCTRCTRCTDCTQCTDCTRCTSCTRCTDCIRCTRCTDCTDCTQCWFSQNLKNKKYVVCNVQLTEAEYKAWISK